MSTIILHNESENQLNLIEKLLEELDIRFDIIKDDKTEELTVWQKGLIEKGLNDFDEFKTVTGEEVKRIALECLK